MFFAESPRAEEEGLDVKESWTVLTVDRSRKHLHQPKVVSRSVLHSREHGRHHRHRQLVRVDLGSYRPRHTLQRNKSWEVVYLLSCALV